MLRDGTEEDISQSIVVVADSPFPAPVRLARHSSRSFTSAPRGTKKKIRNWQPLETKLFRASRNILFTSGFGTVNIFSHRESSDSPLSLEAKAAVLTSITACTTICFLFVGVVILDLDPEEGLYGRLLKFADELC